MTSAEDKGDTDDVQLPATRPGRIQALLLDWAGTTMDYGCMVPAVVFVEVYECQGLPITMEEARTHGRPQQRVHIPRIQPAGQRAPTLAGSPGRPPSEGDVDRMVADFVPLQLACLSEYSALIPGTLEAVEAMRARRMRIGSTTGYLRDNEADNADVLGHRWRCRTPSRPRA